MNVGNWLVGISTACYVAAAFAYMFSNNKPQALMFLGAGIANLGAIWSTWI